MPYPLEPSQVFLPAQYRRGEPTGMVFCPLRQSEIATMRCGEYQDALGCGCQNAAPAEELGRVREAQSRVVDSGPARGAGKGRSSVAPHDYGRCVACGLRPADYARTRECRNCYQKRLYKCVNCGKQKKSASGRLCKSCASLGNRGGKVARALALARKRRAVRALDNLK
jgi:hypothetical protein